MSTPENEEFEAEFGEVIGLLRDGILKIPEERPGPAVWDAIASALGPEAPDLSPVDGLGSDGSDTTGASATDITSAPSWGRRTAFITAVAAALLLVALPVGIALRGGGSPDRQAELAALPGFDGLGRAELEGRDLSLRLDGTPAPEGSYYELWIVDWEGDEAKEVHSLGPVEVAVDGSIAVPEHIDLDRFTGLVVSVEPDDGDPAPSGASILMGRLLDS